MARPLLYVFLPLLTMVFVAASGSAQDPTVEISLGAPEDPTANGTIWSEPLTITFSISGVACATPATWDLTLNAAAPEGVGASWDPVTLAVTVPAGQYLAGPTVHASESTLTIEDPTPNGSVAVNIAIAASSAGGNCVPPPPGNAEMLTTLTVDFAASNLTTTPELAMPSPGLLPAILAVGLALVAIVRRR